VGGCDLGVETFEVLDLTQDYPITPKEHGTAFLMDLRHLWLRSKNQHAILRIRNEVEKGIRTSFYDRDFVLIDSPILTANAAEGTSTLFREPTTSARRRTCHSRGSLPRAGGRVVRARLLFRSDVPRGEVEDAPASDGVLDGRARGSRSSSSTACRSCGGIRRVPRRAAMDRCQEELKTLERDLTKLENVKRPFHAQSPTATPSSC